MNDTKLRGSDIDAKIIDGVWTFMADGEPGHNIDLSGVPLSIPYNIVLKAAQLADGTWFSEHYFDTRWCDDGERELIDEVAERMQAGVNWERDESWVMWEDDTPADPAVTRAYFDAMLALARAWAGVCEQWSNKIEVVGVYDDGEEVGMATVWSSDGTVRVVVYERRLGAEWVRTEDRPLWTWMRRYADELGAERQ